MLSFHVADFVSVFLCNFLDLFILPITLELPSVYLMKSKELSNVVTDTHLFSCLEFLFISSACTDEGQRRLILFWNGNLETNGSVVPFAKSQRV